MGELETTILDMEPNFDLYTCIFKHPTDLLHKVRGTSIGRYHERKLNNELQLVDTTYASKQVCTSGASQDSVQTGDRPRTD